MTPSELRGSRLILALSLSQMAKMLGYAGDNAAHQLRKMEAGKRTIRAPQARLVRAYLEGYRPNDWPNQ